MPRVSATPRQKRLNATQKDRLVQKLVGIANHGLKTALTSDEARWLLARLRELEEKNARN